MKCKHPNYQYFTKDEAIAAIEREFGGKVVKLLLDVLETDERKTWYPHKTDVKFLLDDDSETGYIVTDDELAALLLGYKKDDIFARGILTADGVMVFSTPASLNDFLANDYVARAVKDPLNYVRLPKFAEGLDVLSAVEKEEVALDERELDELADKVAAECG